MSAAKSAPKKTYFELAKEAIVALKERGGSSGQAIKGYITKTYPALNFQQHLLRSALKTGTAKGKLVQVKASWKLAVAEKKTVKPAAKKPTTPKAKKPAAEKVHLLNLIVNVFFKQ